jgi:hypothetical protein
MSGLVAAVHETVTVIVDRICIQRLKVIKTDRNSHRVRAEVDTDNTSGTTDRIQTGHLDSTDPVLHFRSYGSVSLSNLVEVFGGKGVFGKDYFMFGHINLFVSKIVNYEIIVNKKIQNYILQSIRAIVVLCIADRDHCHRLTP